MITIRDCLEKKVTSKDFHLGWVVSANNGWLIVQYTFRDFDWKTLQEASDEDVNEFLSSDLWKKELKKRLERARSRYSRLFFQARTIADMKVLLEENDLKIDVDRLIRGKIRKNAGKKGDERCQER